MAQRKPRPLGPGPPPPAWPPQPAVRVHDWPALATPQWLPLGPFRAWLLSLAPCVQGTSRLQQAASCPSVRRGPPLVWGPRGASRGVGGPRPGFTFRAERSEISMNSGKPELVRTACKRRPGLCEGPGGGAAAQGGREAPKRSAHQKAGSRVGSPREAAPTRGWPARLGPGASRRRALRSGRRCLPDARALGWSPRISVAARGSDLLSKRQQVFGVKMRTNPPGTGQGRQDDARGRRSPSPGPRGGTTRSWWGRPPG